tara:strand:+ start:826 stop:1197 length:372 start_codon:yes stop_codon:yes gene_type:complete
MFGKNASKVNGIAKATPKPNIPYVKSIAPPADVSVPTRRVPKIGPVHEKETKHSVRDIKKVDINPLYKFDLVSTVLDQEDGSVISKRPNNDNANTIKIEKNIKFKIGLVEIWFNISGFIFSKK